MMYSLLVLRERLTSFFKRYENIIVFFAKFFVAYFAMKQITEIGLYNDLAAPIFRPQLLFLICLMFSVCFNFMPYSISYFVLIFMVTLSLSKSIEVALIVFLILLIILFLYVRIAPKESIFIFLMVIAFHFNLQFLVPIIAGLYFGLTSVIPITIGTFLWRNFDIVKFIASENSTKISDAFDLISVPERVFDVFGSLTKSIALNQQWILESIIMSMVVFCVYFVSRMAFDFSKEVAILVGSMLSVVGFFAMIVFTDVKISLAYVLTFSAIAMILAFCIRFLDNVLNYKATEKLEFEDEEFYYYVKAIPKIKSAELEFSELKNKIRDNPKPAGEQKNTAKVPPKPQNTKPADVKTPPKTENAKPAEVKMTTKSEPTKPADKKTPPKTETSKPLDVKTPPKPEPSKPLDLKTPPKPEPSKPLDLKLPSKMEAEKQEEAKAEAAKPGEIRTTPNEEPIKTFTTPGFSMPPKNEPKNTAAKTPPSSNVIILGTKANSENNSTETKNENEKKSSNPVAEQEKKVEENNTKDETKKETTENLEVKDEKKSPILELNKNEDKK